MPVIMLGDQGSRNRVVTRKKSILRPIMVFFKRMKYPFKSPVKGYRPHCVFKIIDFCVGRIKFVGLVVYFLMFFLFLYVVCSRIIFDGSVSGSYNILTPLVGNQVVLCQILTLPGDFQKNSIGKDYCVTSEESQDFCRYYDYMVTTVTRVT